VKHNGITSVELNLGNTCNIKCRTCNPHASSLWAKEYYDIYADKNIYKSHSDFSKTINIFHQFYDEDRPFWDDLQSHIPNLRNMVFYGGEPFLSKKMWKILDYAVRSGHAKNIILEYNTNGTTWPKEVECWKHFKQVRLSFSIDGVRDQFHYMRFPGEWETVYKNMKQALTLEGNISYSWCVTLSPLNIFYVNEIVEELDKNFDSVDLYLNLIHGPDHYNIQCIPNHLKDIIEQKLNKLGNHEKAKYYLPGIIEFMKAGNLDGSWDKFLSLTRQHDLYRNQNYATTFPEFAELIGYRNE
jgi:MoaA/NifB/PqqE/SkfB family radical SAM enzyme